MNLDLPGEAGELAASVRAGLAAAGLGPGQPADVADARRRCSTVLGGLGLWDLDPRDGETECAAAAAAARAAGSLAVPYPVVERLARVPRSSADATALVARAAPVAPLPEGDVSWNLLSTDGAVADMTERRPLPSGLLGDDLHRVDGSGWAAAPANAVALHLVLGSWFQLGLLDAAVELTRRHVTERVQFGKPLAHLQTVQFRLAETVTVLQGVDELARYTVWSLASQRGGARVDAVALRLATLEATDAVLGSAHQLHGAAGFCDENELAWVSRRSLPFRHYPLNTAGTRSWLYDAVAATGFDGLFDAESAAAWGAST